jgi:membrane-associated phospholipid phosphatase
MKRQLLSLFKRPQVTRKDIWLTLAGGLLWLGLTHLRPLFIETRCAETPLLCSNSSVPLIDRYALGKQSSTAEDLSTDTQILSGAWAYLAPVGLHLGRAILEGGPWGAAFLLVGQDALLITETLVFNGSANELARLLVQRPRPYVYGNPTYYGANFANYTSFYSGHTSFSSATNNALFFAMLGRNAPVWFLIFTAAFGQMIILVTGVTRVLAGRHFLTDVLFGAAAGFFISLWVAIAHRGEDAAQ